MSTFDSGLIFVNFDVFSSMEDENARESNKSAVFTRDSDHI